MNEKRPSGSPGLAMQAPLQATYPELRFSKPFFARRRCTYTRSCSIRPVAFISYEHVFPSSRTSRLAQRALGALRLTRSFLLLEDDHDVDWEVDPNGHSQAPHPHRAPLRASLPARRAGTLPPANHVCLCPVRAPGTAT